MRNLKRPIRTEFYQVNAFTDGLLGGNPAGICLMPEEKEEDFYKNIASIMNLSETAFVYIYNGDYQLKWFTRNGTEVDVCGHATLAAAYVLWKRNYIDLNKRIRFYTRSGVLHSSLTRALVSVSFPLEEISSVSNYEYDFSHVIGFVPIYICRTKSDYLLVANTVEEVVNATPIFEQLKELKARGIIITAESNDQHYDYICRFFAPRVGVDEDPVTGSAHCSLGMYWGTRLNKSSLIGYQASKEGGIVYVRISDRIIISGKVEEVPISQELKSKLNDFIM